MSPDEISRYAGGRKRPTEAERRMARLWAELVERYDGTAEGERLGDEEEDEDRHGRETPAGGQSEEDEA